MIAMLQQRFYLLFVIVAFGPLLQFSNGFTVRNPVPAARSKKPFEIIRMDASKTKTAFQEAMEDPYNVATLLLGTVLERRVQDVDFSFDALLSRLTPSYQIMRREQEEKIESLIDTLRQNFDHTYNPGVSLLGQFYSTLYFYTPNVADAPEPLWERLSLKVTNIKGQQYYLDGDFKLKVVNYSEIWGPDFHIRARGFFEPISAPIEESSKPKSWIDKLFGTTKKKTTTPVRECDRSCPDVFKVTATGVSFRIFGFEINLPIEGSSNLVVLYADPRIRIFVSPLDSNSAVGNWEDAGLVVVQVQSGLVPGGTPENLL